MRSFIFILLAALFLGSAAYLGNKYLFDPAKSNPSAGGVVAQTPGLWALRLVKDVERGDILEKGQMTWDLLPRDQKGKHLFIREQTELGDWQGAAFTQSLKKGAYLQDMHLVRPTEADHLKTLLTDGLRARPVAIENLGDFNQLRPGDYVDLIVTYVTPVHAARAGETVVKTILESSRIIAMETAPVTKAMNATRSSETLTLALSPTEVELVSVAETIGKLRISLRGETDPYENFETPAKTAFSASDFFPELKQIPPAAVQFHARDVRIMRGGETTIVTLSPATGR